jgi:hypothetical protein
MAGHMAAGAPAGVTTGGWLSYAARAFAASPPGPEAVIPTPAHRDRTSELATSRISHVGVGWTP